MEIQGSIKLRLVGMNMIYISVSERTKEIGVRRAMGATKGNIVKQFLLEGVTLTLLEVPSAICLACFLEF
ncbi:ABC transporter permease [Enterococcus sp. AZ163]|uniref:ABC transporter permease n=1 Tax=Enterococcus sp. AZ163 TaxID=2774638 RepID=UPI003D2DE0FB